RGLDFRLPWWVLARRAHVPRAARAGRRGSDGTRDLVLPARPAPPDVVRIGSAAGVDASDGRSVRPTGDDASADGPDVGTYHRDARQCVRGVARAPTGHRGPTVAARSKDQRLD